MTDDPVKRTQTFFKNKYGQELTEEEAKDINERITSYFSLLHRLDKRKQADSSDNTTENSQP